MNQKQIRSLPDVLEVHFIHRPTSESPGDPAHWIGDTILIGPGGETVSREFLMGTLDPQLLSFRAFRR
jgi:hypothetical protein